MISAQRKTNVANEIYFTMKPISREAGKDDSFFSKEFYDFLAKRKAAEGMRRNHLRLITL